MIDWDLHENEQVRKEKISAYLDGGLPAEEDRFLCDHITACKECNDYLNSLKLVSSSLEIMLGEEPVDVPGEFSKRVSAAAESNVSGLRGSLRGFHTACIAAGIFSLLVLVIGVGLTQAGSNVTP